MICSRAFYVGSLSLLAALIPEQTILRASIIPQPLEVKEAKGSFTLTTETRIVCTEDLEREAKLLQNLLRLATGYDFPIQTDYAEGPQIKLALNPSLHDLGREGYSLRVLPRGILIEAVTPTGVFYGTQTVARLLPPEIVSKKRTQADWSVPCLTIKDRPRFAWRAFMLDEARHFKGMEEVKKLLDQMASLKMNVFHWHLTDDQGWRIEIKKYPRLTSVGSKRADTQTGGWGSPTRSGKPHSGYYTQEEIREIVACAAERHITIVPEIGMPGHACAAIAAYPELGTTKKPIEVMTIFGKAYDTFDPSDEIVYEMLGDILDEVIALFPSRVIHIGGDEVRFDHWKASESVAKLMKREGLETMADVQLYFTNRMAGIVQSKGRNAMGWNEILGDDLHGFLKDGQTAKNQALDKDTVVHFWTGNPQLAKRAIRDGHTVVNSWAPYTYLDYSYGSIPLSKAYSFDPIIDGLTPEEQKRIVGLGCQMWGEWIPTVADMERQVYPRLAAYAEVGWTEPENKDFHDFRMRIKDQLRRWDIQGIGYARDQVDRLTAADFFNHRRIDIWTPERTPADWEDVTFSMDGQVTSAGTYEIAFVYENGAHAIDIAEVALLEDGKEVAVDTHTGFSGNRMTGIVYTLKLDNHRPGTDYTLRARIKGNGGTDSQGEVKLRAVD